jgi:Leucine-rich repeat (LRR) protein
MTGTIPESIGNLTAVQAVGFWINSLYGTIPTTFGKMHLLVSLDLGYNELTGTIPSQLNTLPALRQLYIDKNHLIGTLPTLEGTSADMTIIYLSRNYLTGTIPASYARFTKLSIFRIGQNFLNGTIPSYLETMVNMTLLGLYQNAFTGTLPNLSGMTQLTSLVIATTYLHGTVPAYFGSLPSLQQLVLTDNYYTGTIPDSIYESKSLQQLYLNYNQLTGSLSDLIGNIKTLTSLRVGFNQLTGTLPASISKAVNLTLLSFASNLFTGTLPPEFGDLVRMTKLDVSNNQLTGTIPAGVCQLTAMLNFTASGCFFTGTIPADIGSLATMEVLALNDNLLTSTLPASLQRAAGLEVLLLHANQLTGTISGKFNKTLQTRLSTVQLSENGFTGDIPEDLFELPALQTAILGTNCFQGTLPAAMCDAPNLRTLSLNGLVSGAACRKPLFPISGAYLASRPIRNGLPSCLFQMNVLDTLQVCGNGITGSLPDDIELGANLIALALSHNKLTGTIPHVFQHRMWYDLDLSSNKLKGTLSADFASVAPNESVSSYLFQANSSDVYQRYYSTAALAMSDNRLSSKIPGVIANMVNISILSGNLFDCNLDHSDLPQHDGNQYSYTCGSNSFNASYATYLGCLLVTLATVALIYYFRERLYAYADIATIVRSVKTWLNFCSLHQDDSGHTIMPRYQCVQMMADELCTTGVYCTVYILAIQLPLSVFFDRYYSTHTYEYAWTVSVAFLSGDAATAFLIVSFSAMLVLLLISFQRAMETMKKAYKEARRKDAVRSIRIVPDDHESVTSLRKWAIFAVYLTVNITIVSLVDVGYVYAVIRAASFYKTLAQLALSAFRLVWSTFGTTYLIRGVQRRLAKTEAEFWKMKDARFFYLQLLIQLLNTVIIPSLVVFAISPDCFHFAFVSPQVITSTYVYDDCQLYTTSVGCVVPDYRVATTAFHPPFTYSYECSASLITFYAPALVYTALFVTFLSPLIDYGRRNLFIHTSRESPVFWMVDKFVPRILRPVNVGTVKFDKKYDLLRPYFDANFLLLTVTSYLGLLLTFGLVFPPLAFVLLLSMYSTVYLSRVQVGRFLTDAVADNLHHYVDTIEKECLGITWRFLRCVRVIIAVMAGFYALFVFDALGDKHGAKDSFAIILVVFAIPVLLWGAVLLYEYRAARLNPVMDPRLPFALGELSAAVEMGPLSDDRTGSKDEQIVNTGLPMEGIANEEVKKKRTQSGEPADTVFNAMHP